MNIINDSILEQVKIEQDPKTALIETAISIVEYRKNTSGNNYKYQRYQENYLNDLYNESFRFCTDIHDCQPGILLETLFYINMHELGVPITPSTGQQDAKGIDFFLFDKQIPIDVTCNATPQVITNKLRREKASVLFIPQFLEQQSIQQRRSREYILEHFADNMLSPKRYLQTMIDINTEFKEILFESLTNKYFHYRNLRIKKVESNDISKLEYTLNSLSSILKRPQ